MPGRVEVRDLHDGAQIAGPVGVAAEFAVPVLLPVRPLQVLGPRSKGIDAPTILLEPIRLPAAVQAGDLHLIAADLVFQVSQQRQWQPLRRKVGAVVADNPRQGAHVPFAGRHPSCHQIPSTHGTPVAAVWVSAERRMAAMARACPHWQLTGNTCWRTQMPRRPTRPAAGCRRPGGRTGPSSRWPRSTPKGQAGDWNAMASLSPTSPMASPPRPGGSHETSR